MSASAVLHYDVSTYIAHRIEELGVYDFFVVPGDTNLDLIDHLVQNSRLREVKCCNELNTGYAADGYARASESKTAVAVVPYMVGGLSILNAVAGAHSERLKVIILSGCPPTSILKSDKATHHTPSPANKDQALHAFKGTTAASVRLESAESAADILDDTFIKCVKESLPVYIELPDDIATAPCSAPVPFTDKLLAAATPDRSDHALSAFKKVWNGAQKPVLLIGSHAHISLSSNDLQQLAEKLGCPVLCQPNGRCFPETHPQYWGLFWPNLTNVEGEKRFMGSDLRIALDVSWSDLSTPGINLNEEKHRLVHLQYRKMTLPNEEIFQPVDMQKLVRAITCSDIIPKPDSRTKPRNLTARQGEIIDSDRPLTMTSLFEGIRHMLREEFNLVVDAGDTWFASSHLNLPDGVDLQMQLPYASIGWALPAALGAQIARPQGRTVLMIGDGGFQMTAQELSTIVRMRLNIIILLFNNLGYRTETAVHDGPYNYFSNWDYTKLATSFMEKKPHVKPYNPYVAEYGETDPDILLFAEKVESQSDLLREIKRVESETDKVAFLECCIRPDDVTPELQRLGERFSKKLFN
ncbi:thiamine diphosphate-binding protein [Aspergillus avenaceus]|uniref:Pyruvate decarboxylase n=1 Tax=Aspergillus avenaceus TaxID=36643 RepID=A0A5N6TX29_ASPAV|nr:thiamine diphosphate-binding protein [Aspergillus avenaceus]